MKQSTGSKDIAGSVPDRGYEANIAIKRVKGVVWFGFPVRTKVMCTRQSSLFCFLFCFF